MKFALFLGCTIPRRVRQYETSGRMVLRQFGIDLVDVPDFGCCGYPVKNVDLKLYTLFSARNMALAEKRGLSILTLCKCCYGSLKMAAHLLKSDESLHKEINAILGKEGLEYNDGPEIKHLLTVLHRDIGLEELKKQISRPFEALNIATHYGCHALRPSNVTGFDDPVAPKLFDELVEATGARSVDWSLKLDCCGAPLLGINDELSMDLTEKKLADAKRSGADYLCVGCPWCQAQFDEVQSMIASMRGKDYHFQSLVYPQLLGLALGMDAQQLGVDLQQLEKNGYKAFWSQEKE
jgi:heterodisulfide reductase subunit B2